MNLNSANINVMVKACRKAAKPLIRDFGEIEKLQVSVKGQVILLRLLIKKLKKF